MALQTMGLSSASPHTHIHQFLKGALYTHTCWLPGLEGFLHTGCFLYLKPVLPECQVPLDLPFMALSSVCNNTLIPSITSLVPACPLSTVSPVRAQSLALLCPQHHPAQGWIQKKCLRIAGEYMYKRERDAKDGACLALVTQP